MKRFGVFLADHLCREYFQKYARRRVEFLRSRMIFVQQGRQVSRRL